MLKIGLTGSIAVGKSYVLNIFNENGFHVLDADKTAREVVRRGTIGLRKLTESFGASILMEDGRLDRKALGAIVFADVGKRELLNSILHPLIFKAQEDWLAICEKKDPGGMAVIDAALMIESGNYKKFDDLVVVWCESEIQLNRLMIRDDIDRSAAKAKISAQMPQDKKKKFASYLIDTSNGFEAAKTNSLEVIGLLRKGGGKKDIV